MQALREWEAEQAAAQELASNAGQVQAGSAEAPAQAPEAQAADASAGGAAGGQGQRQAQSQAEPSALPSQAHAAAQATQPGATASQVVTHPPKPSLPPTRPKPVFSFNASSLPRLYVVHHHISDADWPR